MGKLYLIQLDGRIYSCRCCRSHLAQCDELISKVHILTYLVLTCLWVEFSAIGICGVGGWIPCTCDILVCESCFWNDEVGWGRYIITISCYSIPIQTLEEHFLMTLFLLVSWWWVVCSHSTADMGRPIFSTLCNCSFYHIYCKHITVFLFFLLFCEDVHNYVYGRSFHIRTLCCQYLWVGME